LLSIITLPRRCIAAGQLVHTYIDIPKGIVPPFLRPCFSLADACTPTAHFTRKVASHSWKVVEINQSKMYSQCFSVGKLAVLALCSLTAFAVPTMEPRQSSLPDNHTLNRERADAVKEAFTFAWYCFWSSCGPQSNTRIGMGTRNTRFLTMSYTLSAMATATPGDSNKPCFGASN